MLYEPSAKKLRASYTLYCSESIIDGDRKLLRRTHGVRCEWRRSRRCAVGLTTGVNGDNRSVGAHAPNDCDRVWTGDAWGGSWGNMCLSSFGCTGFSGRFARSMLP